MPDNMDTELETRSPMGYAISTSMREMIVGESGDGTKRLGGDGAFHDAGGSSSAMFILP